MLVGTGVGSGSVEEGADSGMGVKWDSVSSPGWRGPAGFSCVSCARTAEEGERSAGRGLPADWGKRSWEPVAGNKLSGGDEPTCSSSDEPEGDSSGENWMVDGGRAKLQSDRELTEERELAQERPRGGEWQERPRGGEWWRWEGSSGGGPVSYGIR